jgi:transcriptional regulator with XRE-family HTH domain
MKTDYENFERSDGGRRLLRQETLIMDVLEELNRVMKSENISRTGLAQRLGKTKGFVSQILSGGRNLTLRTVADVCWAIGYTPHLEVNRDSRNLVALPSVHSSVHAVDWAVGQPEMEIIERKFVPQIPDAQMTANQELWLVA